ncbi:leucine-rich repeat extensin-like protein 3 isoform X1 [Cucurbita pepo subsp. pepo]|uniref:leucine-rich repeat extensin-like protein 3 isoform X1 n=2 Tax=Cucurbita pepo subsp. pepo TaxID=3664 RepID=UPI000C9D26B0|nr:leucine-rich repeat extensin-like protein 3 isoform X1 [Cucurbita pepo subsp. pepo]
MERLRVVIVCFSIAFASTVVAVPSDVGIHSRRLMFGISGSSSRESLKKVKLQIQEGLISKPQLKYLNVEPNAVSINSPFSLPPFDSLGPSPLPENSPPFCEEAPPYTPQPPSPPRPAGGLPPPPPSGMIYSSHMPPPPPASQPNVPTRSRSPPPPTPPSIIPITPPPPQTTPTISPIIPLVPLTPLAPYPPGNVSSPIPPTGPPSPPHHYGPSPPKHASGPPSYGLSPPVFLPPVVLPPPSGPPPASHGGKPISSGAAWCVAKPTVPDPIIQQAMDYACGSGADCKSIQPNEHCYEPDTVLAHASYAFNSYWQNTKATGGTCDFGGTAMLVTVDPSFEGCKFVLV